VSPGTPESQAAGARYPRTCNLRGQGRGQACDEASYRSASCLLAARNDLVGRVSMPLAQLAKSGAGRLSTTGRNALY
jgi:hypothetical protein